MENFFSDIQIICNNNFDQTINNKPNLERLLVKKFGANEVEKNRINKILDLLKSSIKQREIDSKFILDNDITDYDLKKAYEKLNPEEMQQIKQIVNESLEKELNSRKEKRKDLICNFIVIPIFNFVFCCMGSFLFIGLSFIKTTTIEKALLLISESFVLGGFIIMTCILARRYFCYKKQMSKSIKKEKRLVVLKNLGNLIENNRNLVKERENGRIQSYNDQDIELF